ncbi:MAG: hypothetical protein HQL50_11630, partial [Magnetococcales bacterium]|nr:hypothetical protein [Magnetococcales bacterium]
MCALNSSHNSDAALHGPYRIERWGGGFLRLAEGGGLAVQWPAVAGGETTLHLADLLPLLRQQGVETPVLLRFPSILHARLAAFRQAFRRALHRFDYPSEHAPLYPIKVNPSATVIRTLLDAPEPLAGLEVGSGGELRWALGFLRAGQRLVINGVKDRAMLEGVRQALAMGVRVCWVIERPRDVTLLRHGFTALPAALDLGLRLRLPIPASAGKRPHAHFGMPLPTALKSVEVLKENGWLRALRLLHGHVGSQVARLDDLRQGLESLMVGYASLTEAGAPLGQLDLGGGVAVDTTGSDGPFSCTYDLDDYADMVVGTVQRQCRQAALQPPLLITESGRALTAHHGLLLTSVLDLEPESASMPGSKSELEPKRGAEQNDSLHHDETASTRILADLSLFASVPDAWALGQPFPIVPVAGFASDGAASVPVRIQDATCDADGLFRAYVTAEGVADRLLLPGPLPRLSDTTEGVQPPVLAICLL